MNRSSRRDYLRRIHPRYQQASRGEKRRILDEFCANCGYHRKYAIRLLHGSMLSPRPLRARRPRGSTYGPRLISILQGVWEAADYPWSVRLQALLPEWMPWIRRRFRLSTELERQLLSISPRSIDYRLAAHKRAQQRRLYGRTKPGTLLKHHIPVKTDRWDAKEPGFTEIDLVSHSGSSASGEFCHSLNLTDIHTTWTEARAVLGKGQEAVQQALEEMRQALPFPLQGIDSDNGSEFINAHLYRYSRSQHIQFTRGRPYKKDDNAHIEQKNWTHVRRLLGYLRYDSAEALQAINDLYRNELRLFPNLFLSRPAGSSWRASSASVPVFAGATKRRRPLSSGSAPALPPPWTPCASPNSSGCAIPSTPLCCHSSFRPSSNGSSNSAPRSCETRRSDPPFPTVSTGLHRKKKVAKKKEKTILIGYILKLHDDTPKVTFLSCATGSETPFGCVKHLSVELSESSRLRSSDLRSERSRGGL